MYIDIHTHNRNDTPLMISIINVLGEFERVSEERYCSVGVHPWNAADSADDRLQELQKIANAPQVLAIGECGLDKTRPHFDDLQVNVFEEQISIASQVGKPLVIHCVQAFNEVRTILRRRKVAVPVVFHGFRRKATVANQLLSDGHYLSFGSSILNKNVQDVLLQTPAERFFLETDEWTGDIRELYQVAAEIRQTTEKQIILQVQHNFKTVFGFI